MVQMVTAVTLVKMVTAVTLVKMMTAVTMVQMVTAVTLVPMIPANALVYQEKTAILAPALVKILPEIYVFDMSPIVLNIRTLLTRYIARCLKYTYLIHSTYR